MGQILQKNSIGSLSIISSTQVQLSASVITVGGQQYSLPATTLNASSLGLNGLDTGSLAATRTYAVYAIVNGGGVVGLIASLLTSPVGFSNYAFTGLAFATDGSANIVNTNGISYFPITRIIATGSGTYYPAANCRIIEVEMVGAGGGGGGGGGGAATGGTGGATTLGGFLSAGGGGGGRFADNGGGGGTPAASSPAIVILGIGGGSGDAAELTVSGSETSGGSGAASIFGGGAGGGAGHGTGGGSAQSNTGAGGGGGGGGLGTPSGGGGGAGAYIKALIPNPSSSYAFNVGALAGGGTGVNAGGTGAEGIIILKESF